MEVVLRDPYLIKKIVEAVDYSPSVSKMARVCKQWSDVVLAFCKSKNMSATMVAIAKQAMDFGELGCLDHTLASMTPGDCSSLIIASTRGRRKTHLDRVWTHYQQVRTPESDLVLILRGFEEDHELPNPSIASLLVDYLLEKRFKWPLMDIVCKALADFDHPVVRKLRHVEAISYSYADYERCIATGNPMVLIALQEFGYFRNWSWDECPKTISECDNVHLLDIIWRDHPPSPTTLGTVMEMVSARNNVPEETMDFYNYALERVHEDTNQQPPRKI